MHKNKFFFSTFSCCSKSRDQPQEDIANPDYRTNREIKNVGILKQPQDDLAKSDYRTNREIKKSRNPRTCWGTTKICPNPPKISTISKLFSSKCGNCFGNCAKSSLDHVALWQKQKSKMAALVTSLYHHLVIIPSSLYPTCEQGVFIMGLNIFHKNVTSVDLFRCTCIGPF